MKMDYNTLLLLRKLEAMAAAGSLGAGSAAGAEPVEPAPEPPVEIVEETPTETEKTDLENQVDQAIDDMEAGKEPVIVVDPKTEEASTVTPEEEKKEEVKTENPAGTPKEEEKPAADQTASNDLQSILAMLKAYQNAGRQNAGYTAPVVTTITNADKTANKSEVVKGKAITSEQKAAVEAMLKEYPSGTKWDSNTTYRGSTGCGAYVDMMADRMYGQANAINRCMTRYFGKSDIKANLQPYSVAHVYGGTHWVFILEVYEDGTARVAEGNVGGRVSIGAIYSVDDMMELYVR